MDVCSGNNLPDIKNGAYVINLDKYESIGTHWIAWYVNGDDITYFESVWVEYIPKEIKKFISNKNILTSTYRVQAYNSIMFGNDSITFIDFMLKGKSLLDYAKFFLLTNMKRIIK